LTAGIYLASWLAFFLRYANKSAFKACCDAACAEPSKLRAQRLSSANRSRFICEHHSVSKYSPGPILNAETLLFIVSDPQIRLQNDWVHPSSVSQATSGGLSVIRDRANNSEFKLVWKALKGSSDAKKKERWLRGVYSISAHKVRQSNLPREFAIYDTGLVDQPHHGDIMARVPDKLTHSERERITRALVLAMGRDFRSVTEFRDGAFSDFALPAVAGSSDQNATPTVLS
jgi:hypothetical protein